MKKNMKKKGFTLIELIVVIAILGILAAVLIPKFSGFQDKARATQVLTDAKQIATAIDSMQAEDLNGAYPTDVAKIEELAGVPSLRVKSLTLLKDSTSSKENGGFTLVETIGGKDFTYERASANDKVDKK